MKSVLASIKPKDCELIASRKKTVEIRKNRPKIDTPFKVYMYQTKGNWIYKILEWLGLYQGKVIGEFVCDEIYDVQPHFDIVLSPNQYTFIGAKYDKHNACLSFEELNNYLKGENGYAWHISDLVIYDKPKDLDEFEKPCSHDCKNCKYWYSGSPIDYEPPCCEWEDCVITRPPQSWCYVEELEG